MPIADALVCPVCGAQLGRTEKAVLCPRGHSFDVAKEGYVNLLTGSREGDRMGDDKISCRSRRDFLNKGYYAPLKDALIGFFGNMTGKLLDICCGEGYYTSALGSIPGLDVFGFDISKEAVRLAAKRGGAVYFVANMTKIPVGDASFDFATQLFSPFCETEFARILKPGGLLLSVIPGRRHLWGLKTLLYDEPYENDELFPKSENGYFSLTDVIRVKSEAIMPAVDAAAVFRMTPYFFRTSLTDKAKLEKAEQVSTEIEFLIGIMKRNRDGLVTR